MKDKSSINGELVSVIVPVHNSEKYLDLCLKSIVEQTFKNLEIILVENGSTDNSRELCYKWQKLDHRVVVKCVDEPGISRARNVGLNAVHGQWVMFVDSDDIVLENYVLELYRAVTDAGQKIAVCDFEFIEESNQKTTWSYNLTMPRIVDVYCIFSKSLLPNHFYACGAIYLTSLIKNIKFDEHILIGEDTVFFASAIKRSQRLVYFPIPLYGYVIHNDSTSHCFSNQLKLDELTAWDYVASLFQDQNNVLSLIHMQYATRAHRLLRLAILMDSPLISKLRNETRKYSNEYIKNNTGLIRVIAFKLASSEYNIVFLLYKVCVSVYERIVTKRRRCAYNRKK